MQPGAPVRVRPHQQPDLHAGLLRGRNRRICARSGEQSRSSADVRLPAGPQRPATRRLHVGQHLVLLRVLQQALGDGPVHPGDAHLQTKSVRPGQGGPGGQWLLLRPHASARHERHLRLPQPPLQRGGDPPPVEDVQPGQVHGAGLAGAHPARGDRATPRQRPVRAQGQPVRQAESEDQRHAPAAHAVSLLPPALREPVPGGLPRDPGLPHRRRHAGRSAVRLLVAWRKGLHREPRVGARRCRFGRGVLHVPV
mmetsp:Transcript_61154/g.160760  ORF Transcript_61154/g.160760 Transcript_61154/m.160760 type:complete len:253 (-) Transcript_61154:483-1241(-)